MFSTSVISRCNLDNISTDHIEAIQATDDSAQFACAPATSLWGASSRGESRVKRVDINGNIDRVILDSISDLLDDTIEAYKQVLVACYQG